jgi:hypothetical protein
MSMFQIPVALRGAVPAPFVAEDGGGPVRTSEWQAVSPFLVPVIGYSREAKPLERPLVPSMRVLQINPGRAQPLEATSSAPQAIRTMPDQFAAVSRSPKNTTPKTATRTIESLSTGATREASPSFKARK